MMRFNTCPGSLLKVGLCRPVLAAPRSSSSLGDNTTRGHLATLHFRGGEIGMVRVARGWTMGRAPLELRSISLM